MATVTFTTWADLLTKMLNALAVGVEAGAFTTVSYSNGSLNLSYRSMAELRSVIEWVRGEAAGSTGPHTITTGDSLSADSQRVGLSGGTGTMTQNGGSNTSSYLYVGLSAGSNGTYYLSDVH